MFRTWNFEDKNSFASREAGFTLLELIVAVGVFAIVISLASGLFVAILRAQHNAEQNQNAADNARSAMEIMARTIRVSTFLTSTASSIDVTSQVKIAGSCLIPPCQIRYARSVTVSECGGAKACITEQNLGVPGEAPQPITSQQINIKKLEFIASGIGIAESPNLQPRVTIVLEAEGLSAKPGERATLNLQTTLTQRNLGLF